MNESEAGRLATMEKLIHQARLTTSEWERRMALEAELEQQKVVMTERDTQLREAEGHMAALTGELETTQKDLMEVVQLVKVARERQQVAERDLRIRADQVQHLREQLSVYQSTPALTSSATPGMSSHLPSSQ